MYWQRVVSSQILLIAKAFSIENSSQKQSFLYKLVWNRNIYQWFVVCWSIIDNTRNRFDKEINQLSESNPNFETDKPLTPLLMDLIKPKEKRTNKICGECGLSWERRFFSPFGRKISLSRTISKNKQLNVEFGIFKPQYP